MSAPGHRFPFDPIRDRCGGLIADSATRLGIHHQTALKHQERGLSAAVADVLAAWAEVTSLTLQESGDYAGLATSESDVYAPAQPIQFFVPREGGKVRADVLGPERRTEGGDLIGDPWEYDVDCGITLTVDEVSALLG